MRKMEVAAAAALIDAGAGAASAQNFNGAEFIKAGDMAGAERVIMAQRHQFPHDADLLLNLATVYARTGRVIEARSMYQAVMAQPDEELDLLGGRVATAHALATDGMRRLPTDLARR